MKPFSIIILLSAILSTMSFGQSDWPYAPVDQPDADGRIITGRAGTHHWQKYMEDADLSTYHHAPEEAIEAFKDLKYGIRIHWGIYSIIHGQESWGLKHNNYSGIPELAYQGFYHDLYKAWDPRGFDAEAWTDMMKENQFRFFVFTTKHHDGFSMYDTKTRITKRTVFFGEHEGEVEECNLAYSIMETPFGRDVTGELIASARHKGLKIGLYFSNPDWYDADFRFDQWNPNIDTSYTPESQPESWARFEARYREQIREILTNYGKVDMLSLDMWLPEFAWPFMQEMAQYARSLQPDVMIRWRGIGNYGDYHTPENYIPGDESQGTMAWQVIHTLSTRKIFSYEPDENYLRDGEWIVSRLIDIVSKGGNLMIGVGPDLTGQWHPKVVEALEYAGDWLKVNGEAIFETRPCERTRDGNVFFTRSKDNKYTYAISTIWPGESLFLDGISVNEGSSIYMLGHSNPLEYRETRDGVEVFMPEKLRDPGSRPCKQAWVFNLNGRQTTELIERAP
ncbi:alpha-L-fucosidase [Bacteroidota bacterium]